MNVLPPEQIASPRAPCLPTGITIISMSWVFLFRGARAGEAMADNQDAEGSPEANCECRPLVLSLCTTRCRCQRAER
jgi:hypothetical protein